MQPAPESDYSDVFLWVMSAASLLGIGWLWLNLDIEGTIAKLMIVGLLGAFWIGVVFAAGGLIALVLGMVGFVVRPFRRK